MINEQRRMFASCRRFTFESLKSIGIFWIIDKVEWLRIKEPWNKLYERTKKS